MNINDEYKKVSINSKWKPKPGKYEGFDIITVSKILTIDYKNVISFNEFHSLWSYEKLLKNYKLYLK